MKTKTKNNKTVSLKNLETVHRRFSPHPTRRAWIALRAEVGNAAIGKDPIGRPLHEIECAYRMSIEGELQTEEKFSFRGVQRERPTALVDALERALSDFKERIGCFEVEDLNQWKITIIADDADFLANLPDEVRYGKLSLKYVRELKAGEASSDDVSALLFDEDAYLSIF